RLPNEIGALTFWVTIYGAQAGDSIAMTIMGPGGDIYASRDIVQDKTRARQFYFAGKKTGGKNPIPPVLDRHAGPAPHDGVRQHDGAGCHPAAGTRPLLAVAAQQPIKRAIAAMLRLCRV